MFKSALDPYWEWLSTLPIEDQLSVMNEVEEYLNGPEFRAKQKQIIDSVIILKQNYLDFIDKQVRNVWQENSLK